MNKILFLAITALVLAGCASSRFDNNVATGALIGAGTGALIGGVARNSVGGAVTGGVIGAVAGGLIGAAATPRRCYVRMRYGRLRRVPCY